MSSWEGRENILWGDDVGIGEECLGKGCDVVWDKIVNENKACG